MTISITANIDEADSRDFTAFCEAVGLIEQTYDPFYSPENQAYVIKSIGELRGRQRPSS